MMRAGNCHTLAAQRPQACLQSRWSTESVLRSPDPQEVSDEAYDHVLHLLGFSRALQPDHPVFEALHHASYTTLSSLFTLCRADVELLTYLDTSVTPAIWTSLPRGNQTQLLVPKGYREYFHMIHQRSITDSDWLVTTRDEINDYLMSIEYMYYNNSDRTSSDTASHVIIPACQVAVPEPHIASLIGEKESDDFKALGIVPSSIREDKLKAFEDDDSHGYQETNMSSVSKMNKVSDSVSKARTVKKKNWSNKLLGRSARSNDGP